MDAASQPRAWKVLLAFAIIYFVWGSTFLAIRVGVREVPPFLVGGDAFSGCGNRALWLDAGPGHAFSDGARVGRGLVARGADFCFRLRIAVLGGAASAVGDRGGHDGDDSGVHGAGGDCLPSNAASDHATGAGAAGGDGRRRRSGGTRDEFGRSSDRYRGGVRFDRRGHQLVGGGVSQSQDAAARRQSHEFRERRCWREACCSR